MRLRCRTLKKALSFGLVAGVLTLLLQLWWSPGDRHSAVDIQSVVQRAAVLKGYNNNASLESYANIPYRVKDEVAGRLPRHTCECLAEEGLMSLTRILHPLQGRLAHNLQRAYLGSQQDPEGVKSLRSREYQDFKRRSYTPTDQLIVAQANSPLQYPTQGVEVRPLGTIILPGLALKIKEENVTTRRLHAVKLTATLGVFDVAATVDGVALAGAGEKTMEVSGADLAVLNRQLQFVTYTNTQYHPRTADAVLFETAGDGEKHRAAFTVKVAHALRPKLYNSGGGGGGSTTDGEEYNVSALVTVATKTFLRYDKLRELIASVRLFYPDVSIVVADDSERPQPVVGHRVEHYTMPFGKGWFAGRNLAVSQVATKYVLWVDDDFIFTSATRLEKMVEVLEKTTLDVVAGAVREVSGYAATYRHTITVEEGGEEEGDCLRLERGHHHRIEGFPGCVVTDGVVNFFMARTEKVRQVGFDPRLARRGHLEFFVDGLGSLHVGSCEDVVVDHASKIKLPWSGEKPEDRAYEAFRYDAPQGNANDELLYFKNRLKCRN